MTTLDEYSSLAAYKFCVFGRAKVGKTALVASLARIWKLHYFDLEGGIKTALKPEILAPEFRKNISVYNLPSRLTAPIGIETLLKVMHGGEKKICWDHGKVDCPACTKAGGKINSINIDTLGTDDCVVIDSSTQLSADARNASIAFITRDAVTPEQFVLDKDTGGKDFKYPAAVNFMLDKIMSKLQTAPFNAVVISHEVMTERTKDTAKPVKIGESQPNDGVEMIFPAAGSRNFSRQFGRYFDMLIHLDIVNRKHRAFSSTLYSANVQTGSRLPYNIEEMYIGDPAKKEVMNPADALVEIIKRARAEGVKKP